MVASVWSMFMWLKMCQNCGAFAQAWKIGGRVGGGGVWEFHADDKQIHFTFEMGNSEKK